MDINAGIIDQWVNGIVKEQEELLESLVPSGDVTRKKSAAFVLLCIATFRRGDLLEILKPNLNLKH
ncbi:MAG: hypothetical protein LBP87_04270 [Planctomycetaceae bacterium]|jgi:hypothetical protein|nr:hypothetical protein [Planctomycetaceae bacterium]